MCSFPTKQKISRAGFKPGISWKKLPIPYQWANLEDIIHPVKVLIIACGLIYESTVITYPAFTGILQFVIYSVADSYIKSDEYDQYG